MALRTQVVRKVAKYQTAKPGHIPLASKMRNYFVPLTSQVKKNKTSITIRRGPHKNIICFFENKQPLNAAWENNHSLFTQLLPYNDGPG